MALPIASVRWSVSKHRRVSLDPSFAPVPERSIHSTGRCSMPSASPSASESGSAERSSSAMSSERLTMESSDDIVLR